VAQVAITVRNCGLVREESVVEVAGEVILGDSRKAVVRYPGAPVALRAAGDRVVARGLALGPGQRLVLQEKPVEVTIEVLAGGGFGVVRLPPMPDLRLAIATGAVVLLAVWLDQLGAFVRDQPEVAAGIAALMARAEQSVLPGEPAPAPVSARWVGEVQVEGGDSDPE
jgi:hypothetical protein